MTNVRWLGFVIALAVAGRAAALAEASTVAVTVARERGAVIIEATALLRADAQTAWQVLTDYDHYALFIPGLRSSRVLTRHGSRVVVDQSGNAARALPLLPLHITYDITEYPPYRIRSRATAALFPPLESSYVLTPDDAGVRLAYTGRFTPTFALFGEFEQWVVRERVTREFQALANEIERRRSVVAGNRDAIGR